MYRIGILEKDETYLNMESDYSIEVENVTEYGETYRVYHMDDEIIDRPAVKMLTENKIKGLPQIIYRDGELRFRITDMKSLYEYIQENNSPEGKRRLLKIFAGILGTALSLEAYMLSADRLMMNPREIFVDESNCEAIVPYIPFQSDEENDIRQCLEKIRSLCGILLEGIESREIYGDTEVFDNLQKNALESLELKEATDGYPEGEWESVPYIMRKKTGEKIPVDRNIFKLGKDASYVDYCVRDNPTVSRNHADIVRKPDGFYLIDKGSLNHTFVNGRKLEADEYRKLEDGYLLQLSDEVFEFVINI